MHALHPPLHLKHALIELMSHTSSRTKSSPASQLKRSSSSQASSLPISAPKRSPSFRPKRSPSFQPKRSPSVSGLTKEAASPRAKSPDFAILDFHDICVTLANGSSNDEDHEPLLSYEYAEPLYDNEVACWVPIGLDNDRFCIHVGYDGDSLPYPEAQLRAEVYIDGLGPLVWTYVSTEDMLQRIKEKAKGEPLSAGDMEMTGKLLSKQGLIEPFCFSLRSTVETGKCESDIAPENIDYFGEIWVRVFWAKMSSPTKSETDSDDSSDEDDSALLAKPVNERLKHVQHRFCARLGKAEIDDEASHRKHYHFERVNEDDFWFIFKYRDIGWLELKKIAPKHAS